LFREIPLTAISSDALAVDLAIVGGGIAGLWSLAVAVAAGYNAVLVERSALGQGQTIASQGMIHGGLKYALSGEPSAASEALASMPDRWREHLAGRALPDLSKVRCLSDHLLLWSSSGWTGRFSTLLASRLLHGQIEPAGVAQVPPLLQDLARQGRTYRLYDPVIDVPSLLQSLAAAARGRIIQAEPCLAFDGATVRLHLQPYGLVLTPRRVVLSAGAGNPALLRGAAGEVALMARLPLQQVWVEHDSPIDLFGHCIGLQTSPLLTVSTHPAPEGRRLWYLGGELATGAADMPPERLIAQAQRRLVDCLPGLSLRAARWGTLQVDRAEAAQTGGRQLAGAHLASAPGLPDVWLAWPGKLTLAPQLGHLLLAQLQASGVAPSRAPLPAELRHLPAPGLAPLPWATAP
jgi:glycine/D-amino acid oxidase-like deaminating enzyme